MIGVQLSMHVLLSMLPACWRGGVKLEWMMCPSWAWNWNCSKQQREKESEKDKEIDGWMDSL